MPRREGVLDPADGPVQEFAAGLRELRRNAGQPTYRELARRARYSAPTLSTAAAGRQLPSLPVALAYVEACGGDPAMWEARWRVVADGLGEDARAGADAVPPYRGLAAYQPDDAAWFFGREQLVGQLLESLSSRRLLAVFGASGSGKSSVLRAGVMPRVAEGALSPGAEWPVAVMTPGYDPVAALAAAVAQALPAANLAGDPGTLGSAVTEALGDVPATVELLLVVDQFEELFTLCADDAVRRTFLAGLLDAAAPPHSRLRVVLGVRADFYARCALYPDLVTALRDAQALVGPMNAVELRDALVRPAERAGLRVDGALVSTVVAQLTDRPGALPLASHAMTQAWRRRQGTTITLAAYESAGGVNGAIAKSAEGVYTELGPARRDNLRRVLLRLVDIGDDAVVTRRRVPRDEFDPGDPDVSTVIDRLAAARLVTVTQGTVEITHEALVAAWPRLRGWVDEDHEGLRLHRLLTHAAAEWEALGRDDGTLYRGTRLARAADWLAEHPEGATPRERDFVQQGLAVEHRTRVIRRRRQRSLVAVLLTAVIAVSALAVATVVQASRARHQQSQAQRQHDLALSRQLAAQSLNLSPTRPVTARRLAVAAWAVNPTDEAREAMTALMTQQSGSLIGHTGAVYRAEFSPDGKILATTSHDGTVRLWDPRARTSAGKPLTGHTAQVNGVAFSPDGRHLATGSDDGTLRLWDVATGRPVGSTPRHGGRVQGVAFSSDGKLLATGSGDGSVHLWNPGTLEAVGKPMTGHTGPVNGVEFGPGDKVLATAGSDETVRLWNTTTQQPAAAPLAGHVGFVWDVAFSPDGRLLATAGEDRTIRIWDRATRQPVGQPLTGHNGPIWDVAFSPDGKLLAAASSDMTTRMWDPATREPAGQPLTGHNGPVWGLTFSRDSRLLVTVSDDHTVRLWDPATSQPADGSLTGHDGAVWGIAFSPGGEFLATASYDHTVRLWDPRTREPVGKPLTGHTGQLWSLRFSPDGRLLASASEDRTVRLWDTQTWQVIGEPLTGYADDVRDVAFSPDGKLLAAASDDRTVQLWDTATRRPVGKPLTGHTGFVNGVEFSPDGKLFATASEDLTVRLWDTATRQPVGEPLTGHTGPLWSVAFSPDGALFATASDDHTVRLWNTATRQPVGEPLTGHTSPLWSVAFSPDGKLLATAGEDKTVRLWDLATREPVSGSLAGHTTFVNAVAFSPDGTLLAAGGEDQTARLWNMTEYLNPAQVLCGQVGPPTADEWSTHAPREPAPATCAGA